MQKYIALLRGINVSGKNRIQMNELRQMFEELGFSAVRTYIQSGNVIFKSIQNNHLKINQLISDKITENYGFIVPVIVLSFDEMKKAIENNPFILDLTKNPVFMHLTFLSKIPQKINIEKINDKGFLPDEFVLNQKVIYLYCPQGYGTTKLTNTFFENKLKVSATTRNWRTVNELLKLCDSDLKV